MKTKKIWDLDLDNEMTLNDINLENVESIAELTPIRDSAKSFYNKAKVIKMKGGMLLLLSYDTIVADILDNHLCVHNVYTATTNRHIKEFEYQYIN